MGDGDVLSLMRLSDGATCNYIATVNVLDFAGSMNSTVQDYAYDKVNIGGVTYDVQLPYANARGDIEVILYYNGSPAAKMYNSEDCHFLEGFDPETLKAQQNANDLGTVTPGENPIDGLESGKIYNVSVIGSNDIHLEGAENVSGTVTQTFDIPVQFVNNPNVKFVAVHVTNSHAEALEEAFNTYRSMSDKLHVAIRQHENGEISLEELNKVKQLHGEALAEYLRLKDPYEAWELENSEKAYDHGTVTVAADGKTLTATHTVDSFSPFIVYAFAEADELEIKTITTHNIPDESTPHAPAPVVETIPGSPIFLWITIMSLAAIALLAVVIVVRKRSRR